MGWLRVESNIGHGSDRVTFGSSRDAGWPVFSLSIEGVSRLNIYKDRKHYTKETWREYIRGDYPKE